MGVIIHFFRFWYQQEDGRTDARVSAMMQQGNVHHLRRCYMANMGLDHVILLVWARFSLLPADLNITSRAVLSAMFNFVGHYIQEMLPHEFQDWLLINLELRPTLSILIVSPLYRYILIFWLIKYVQIPLNHQFSSSLVLQIPSIRRCKQTQVKPLHPYILSAGLWSWCHPHQIYHETDPFFLCHRRTLSTCRAKLIGWNEFLPYS